MENKTLRNRKGQIEFSRELLSNSSLTEFEAIFSIFFPMTIEAKNFGDTLIYCGFSSLFREVEIGEVIPTYKMWFIRDNENGKVVFQKFEEVIIK